MINCSTNTPKGVAPKIIISSRWSDPEEALGERLGVKVTAFNIDDR